MKLISPPQTGRVGDVVNVISRYGQLARKYTVPRNPRTPRQQANRGSFGAVVRRWRRLDPEQRLAWGVAAANNYTVNRQGKRMALNGYNHFVSINAARAAKALSLFDLPPAVPTFPPNPVAELAISNAGDNLSLKLHVTSQPGQYTLVCGAAPVSAGVRCVQHFVFLGFLPAAEDGWSDITELYVKRYGQPPVGQVVYLRTSQHIDGWVDVAKEASAVVPGR